MPQEVRRNLGIRKGCKVKFTVVGDHVEMRSLSTPSKVPDNDFGMLKSKRRAVAADFDPASLLNSQRSER
jgi:bifunctional DNA-binding transcriptional regulator/antitoxin component of YhaV-PrlF toxin-antitoxin module